MLLKKISVARSGNPRAVVRVKLSCYVRRNQLLEPRVCHNRCYSKRRRRVTRRETRAMLNVVVRLRLLASKVIKVHVTVKRAARRYVRCWLLSLICCVNAALAVRHRKARPATARFLLLLSAIALLVGTRDMATGGDMAALLAANQQRDMVWRTATAR